MKTDDYFNDYDTDESKQYQCFVQNTSSSQNIRQWFANKLAENHAEVRMYNASVAHPSHHLSPISRMAHVD